MHEQVLVEHLRRKIEDAIERTDHLLCLVPSDRLDWRPAMQGAPGSLVNLGELIGHLLDCVAGFCACFLAAFPKELERFEGLKGLRVNHFCTTAEARKRIELYFECIQSGLNVCTDSKLARKIPTVFVPKGEDLLTILLGNLEHLGNHKYQLFFYLKLLGLPVGTADLYRWKGN